MDYVEIYGKNKSKIKELKEKVLQKIKPTPAEEKAIKETAEEIIYLISRFSKAKDIVFAGSAARGTNLRGNHDLDIFFIYPHSMSSEAIVSDLFLACKKVFSKVMTNYAKHPYFITEYNGFKVELVPCYEWDGKSKIKSAVDRTPKHLEFIKYNLTDKQKDDVRILKQFLKNNELYGAEIAIGGFSGYLCELLIYYYGSFENLILSATMWQRGEFIKTNEKYEGEPWHLIVPDPVDCRRNVASPVSLRKFYEFILLCREFIKHPKEEFFFYEFKPINMIDMEHIFNTKGTYFIFAIAERPPTKVDDVVYGKLLNDYKKVLPKLKEYRLIYSEIFLNKDYCLICFEFEDSHLSNIDKKIGPPVDFLEHCDLFLEKHKKAMIGPYIYEDRICVERYENHKSIRTILQETLNNFDYKIVENDGILEYYNKISIELTKFLLRKHPMCYYYL